MLLHEQIEHLCESLKLNSIPTHWSSLAEQCIAQDKSYGEFLLSLLKCEQQQRDERTRNLLSRMAGFPAHKELNTFDFKFATGIPKQHIHEFRNLQKRSINLKTRKNQGVHILSGYPCIKDIYKTFLQVSSLRYSGLALSEVSPSPLSHDTVSRWLKSRCFRPKDLWRLVEPSIDKKSPCVLIADDTLIAKTRSHEFRTGI